MRRAASASRAGITMMSMNLSSVPSLSMSLIQARLHGAQLLADLQLLLLEVLELLLLLGRQDHARICRCAWIATGSASACVCCSSCSSCCSWRGKRSSAVRRRASTRIEGTREAGAAAHADQIRAAGEIVERVQHQVAVARPGLRDMCWPKKFCSRTHRKSDKQVGVGEDDEVEWLGRRLQAR